MIALYAFLALELAVVAGLVGKTIGEARRDKFWNRQLAQLNAELQQRYTEPGSNIKHEVVV